MAVVMRCLLIVALGFGFTVLTVAADRPVDPTFLFRQLDSAAFVDSDVTTSTCRYRPLFGEGDSQTSVVKGVARYGEIVVGPGGACKSVSYPDEEQIYFVLEGDGAVDYRGDLQAVTPGDFAYFAPTTEHGVRNPSREPMRLIVMGFKTPKDLTHGAPVKLPIANAGEAEKQVVGNHPPSTLYQLLLGSTTSKRDLLSVGHTVTSLFIMEFTPGGTNHPHHHPTEEEIYLLLDGSGEMVAGGGMDGVEGRHRAQPGDAYFYRLNATVGFYSDSRPGAGKARILAVRSRYPR